MLATGARKSVYILVWRKQILEKSSVGLKYVAEDKICVLFDLWSCTFLAVMQLLLFQVLGKFLISWPIFDFTKSKREFEKRQQLFKLMHSENWSSRNKSLEEAISKINYTTNTNVMIRNVANFVFHSSKIISVEMIWVLMTWPQDCEVKKIKKWKQNFSVTKILWRAK